MCTDDFKSNDGTNDIKETVDEGVSDSITCSDITTWQKLKVKKKFKKNDSEIFRFLINTATFHQSFNIGSDQNECKKQLNSHENDLPMA